MGITIKTADTLTQESKFNPDSQQGAKTKIRTKTNHPHIYSFIRVHNKKGTLINELYKTSSIPLPSHIHPAHPIHIIHKCIRVLRTKSLETRDSRLKDSRTTQNPQVPAQLFSPCFARDHNTLCVIPSQQPDSPVRVLKG